MLVQIKFLDTNINRRSKNSILDRFIKSHKVLVQCFLEFRELVVAAHAWDKRLESANHVSIEAHAYHLNDHLI